jgi:D-amino-acid dehydrogenase
MKKPSSAIVVGAGMVGLCCAYALHHRGVKVTIVDRDPAGDKTSYGNAGALAISECVPHSLPGQMWSIPKWLIDPMGPLSIRPAHIPHLIPWLLSYLGHSRTKNVAHIAKALHAINCRVSADYDPMLAKIGYADKVRDKGCIRVYDNYENFKLSAQEWAIRKQYGQHYELLGEEDLRAMEPSIGKAKTFGVLQPQWRIIDDPKELVSSLREWLVSQGVAILAANVDTLITQDKHVVGIKTSSGEYVADVTVVAAGAWSKQLSKQVGETCLLESERGYNTTLPYPNIQLNHELLFAEQMFAVSPLSMGVRVGGASEFAGLSAAPNYKRSDNLLALAKRFLPELDTQNGQKWMGHRPSTPDSLPVLGPSVKWQGLAYAFGHAHLGMTQAATSGQMLAEVLLEPEKGTDLSAYSIGRFNG